MSYSDFVDLIIPLEPYYESLAKDRVTRNERNQFTFFELYSYRTRDCVKALFQMAASNEAQLSSLRSSLLVNSLDDRSTEKLYSIVLTCAALAESTAPSFSDSASATACL